MYAAGTLPLWALLAPFVTILITLLVVTPMMMFLGYG
jgi:hypothetical protein